MLVASILLRQEGEHNKKNYLRRISVYTLEMKLKLCTRWTSRWFKIVKIEQRDYLCCIFESIPKLKCSISQKCHIKSLDNIQYKVVTGFDSIKIAPSAVKVMVSDLVKYISLK